MTAATRQGLPVDLSLADRLVFERGEFDPLEFLVRVGALDEHDLRDWLSGRRNALQSALLCDVNDAIGALEQGGTYLAQQRLVPKGRDDAPAQGPVIGSNTRFAELCSCRLVPAQSQLDLFRDSALAVSERDVRQAFACGDRHSIDRALTRFESLGGHPSDYRQLLRAAALESFSPAAHLRELEVIAPLAARCLGEQGADYLAALWQRLAARLRGVPFQPADPQLHESYALAQAGQWRQLIEVLDAEPDGQAHPALRIRQAEACARLGDHAAARRLWSALCWDCPQAATPVLGTAPGDPALARRWCEFADLEPELPAHDFPAWLLVTDARQREYVPRSDAPRNAIGTAYTAIHDLLRRHDDMEARRIVHGYNTVLLAHYLRRRNPAHGGRSAQRTH